MTIARFLKLRGIDIWGTGNSLLRSAVWALKDVPQHPWPPPIDAIPQAVTIRNVSTQ